MNVLNKPSGTKRPMAKGCSSTAIVNIDLEGLFSTDDGLEFCEDKNTVSGVYTDNNTANGSIGQTTLILVGRSAEVLGPLKSGSLMPLQSDTEVQRDTQNESARSPKKIVKKNSFTTPHAKPKTKPREKRSGLTIERELNGVVNRSTAASSSQENDFGVLAVRQQNLNTPLHELAPHTYAVVASLKGISVRNISKAIGVSANAVALYFSGASKALRQVSIQILAEVLGLNLRTGRLRSDQVHVFNFSNLGMLSSRTQFIQMVKELEELLADTKVVSVEFPLISSMKRAMASPIHVVQSSEIRAIFIGSRRARYVASLSLALPVACNWAIRNEKESVVKVYQEELLLKMLSEDMTPIEFDELFIGKSVLSWANIQAAARLHQVSKKDLMAWIESRAQPGSFTAPGRQGLTLAIPSLRQTAIN